MARVVLNPKMSFSRVFLLRALLCATLLGGAALIGWTAYSVLQASEERTANSVYESVALAALQNTQVAFSRAARGANMMASAYSSALPSESMWPNAYVGGFIETVTQLVDITSVATYTFAPVLRPDQVAAWETFAFNLWDTDPGIPKERAYLQTTGERGIWQFNPAIPFPGSIFLDDKSGDTVWGDNDTVRILLPITQTLNFDVLGINMFPNRVNGPLFEKSLLCASARNIKDARANCTSVVPPIQLPLPNPKNPMPSIPTDYQTAVFAPISIVGDDGTTKVVGGVGGGLVWSDLLLNTVPSFVGEMDVVVEATGEDGTGEVFTFEFKKGKPSLKGIGDLHDTRYSHKRMSGALYPASLIGIAESSKYTITFYPRKAFYDEYKSNNPIYFTIGGVSLIALVSLIFLLYDFAVSRQSERQQIVLDTKRRYVRFISHEIRTPLNTVRLGLKLFDLELVASLKMLSEKSPAEAVQLMTKTIENWIQLTDDALSSTEAAVDVLNDLLNYDKVSCCQLSTTRYPLSLMLYAVH
ncbi:hypothetical protein B484DRAFT_40342 [Ochromonadaceae sp. CCMP2298]|nr:hypothetical protein B484DRAFT_40342 [Ochromonadaceae sp. CCMP2298]